MRTQPEIISDQAGRMKQDIKARWIAALRSGDYLPLDGQPFLCRIKGREKRWNALGVLCDIMSIPAEVMNVTPEFTIIRFDGGDCFLTPRVCALAGIPSTRGGMVTRIFIDRSIYAQGYSIHELSQKNMYSFDRLADIIEEQL